MRQLTREEAIADLRKKLEELAGDEHSVCYVAARHGVFCKGFRQWKFHELKELYPQIDRTRPHLTREEFEELADRWQLARQFVLDEPTSCDAQLEETKFQTCKGWDEFTDQRIADFYHDLIGEEVEIRKAG